MTDWFSQIIVTSGIEKLFMNSLTKFTTVAMMQAFSSQAFAVLVLVTSSMQKWRGMLQAIENWSGEGLLTLCSIIIIVMVM